MYVDRGRWWFNFSRRVFEIGKLKIGFGEKKYWGIRIMDPSGTIPSPPGSLSNAVRASLSRRESEDRNNCLRPQVDPDEVISSSLRAALQEEFPFSPRVRMRIDRIQRLGIPLNVERGVCVDGAANWGEEGPKIVEDLVEFVGDIQGAVGKLGEIEEDITTSGDTMEKILGPLGALKEALEGEDESSTMAQCLQAAVNAAREKIQSADLEGKLVSYQKQ